MTKSPVQRIQLVLATFAFVFLLSCVTRDNKTSSFSTEDPPQDAALVAPGLISTKLFERDFALSPNGEEIIFTRGTPNQSHRSLVQIRKVDGAWHNPKILPISGEYQDIEPFYSPDGQYLYFASNRPMDASDSTSDVNIWRTLQENGEWSHAEALPELINTADQEYFPAVSTNYNLYYTATRSDGIGREDIFMSVYMDGTYQAPQVLDSAINSSLFEFNAYISPDEKVLIFSSFGREDDLGGGDLYIAQKSDDGRWQPAKNMGPKINSKKLDYCPFLDIKNSVLYWTSDKVDVVPQKITRVDEYEDYFNSIQNGFGNIYYIGYTPEIF